MYYTSGEVSRYLHVTVRTLRYYDQIDLVKPAYTEETGRRMYTKDELFQLEKIILLKSLGMSLNDIKHIINKVTIAQILGIHKEKLEKEMVTLQESLKHTNTLHNIVKLEGDLNWEQLLPLIEQNTEQERKNAWNDYFNAEEQVALQERLPKMEEHSTKKWINLIRRIELCIQNKQLPQSTEGLLIAEDVLLLSEDLFQGNEQLAEQFWKVRRSEEASKNTGLYPVSQEVLLFVEEAIAAFKINK